MLFSPFIVVPSKQNSKVCRYWGSFFQSNIWKFLISRFCYLQKIAMLLSSVDTHDNYSQIFVQGMCRYWGLFFQSNIWKFLISRFCYLQKIAMLLSSVDTLDNSYTAIRSKKIQQTAYLLAHAWSVFGDVINQIHKVSAIYCANNYTLSQPKNDRDVTECA